MLRFSNCKLTSRTKIIKIAWNHRSYNLNIAHETVAEGSWIKKRSIDYLSYSNSYQKSTLQKTLNKLNGAVSTISFKMQHFSGKCVSVCVQCSLHAFVVFMFRKQDYRQSYSWTPSLGSLFCFMFPATEFSCYARRSTAAQ